MQYFIRPHPADGMWISVMAITEYAPGRRVVTQQVGRPYAQMQYVLTPESGQTRLEIVSRRPGHLTDDTGVAAAEYLQKVLADYKSLIEGPGEPGSP
jgi:hypothetical protein